MGRLASLKYVAATSLLLPVSAALMWPGRLWIVAVLIAWLIAVSALWIKADRMNCQERMSRTVHAMQHAGIRTLNHHRHDWMNDLQVLYGYIRLGKLDKSIQYVEKIRERMAGESAVAKLGVTSLVSYIQSFRTLTNSLTLEVAIQEGLNLSDMALDEEGVAHTIMETINAYRFAAKTGYEAPSMLRVELSHDDAALYAAFYYEGELINEQQWKQKIQQQLMGAPMKPVGQEHTVTSMLLRAEMRA